MGDRLVPATAVRTAIEVMPPRRDSRLAFYKEGYHLLMRDKQGPVVWADVAAWLRDPTAPVPSGAPPIPGSPARGLETHAAAGL